MIQKFIIYKTTKAIAYHLKFAVIIITKRINYINVYLDVQIINGSLAMCL